MSSLKHTHNTQLKLSEFKRRHCVILPHNLNQLICHVDQSCYYKLQLFFVPQTMKYFCSSKKSNLWIITYLPSVWILVFFFFVRMTISFAIFARTFDVPVICIRFGDSRIIITILSDEDQNQFVFLFISISFVIKYFFIIFAWQKWIQSETEAICHDLLHLRVV